MRKVSKPSNCGVFLTFCPLKSLIYYSFLFFSVFLWDLVFIAEQVVFFTLILVVLSIPKKIHGESNMPKLHFKVNSPRPNPFLTWSYAWSKFAWKKIYAQLVLTVFFVSGWPICINFPAVRMQLFLTEVDGHTKPMYGGQQSCHEAFLHIYFFIIFS